VSLEESASWKILARLDAEESPDSEPDERRLYTYLIAFVVEGLGMDMVVPFIDYKGIRAGQYRRKPIKRKRTRLILVETLREENLTEKVCRVS
jgi:hypothetical protein